MFGAACQRAPRRKAAWDNLQILNEWPGDKGYKNLLTQGVFRGLNAF